MATDVFPSQSADLNGVPFHIRVPKEEYIEAKMNSLQPESLHFYPMTSTESPPLSALEITDIEESEREFSSRSSQVYNNVTDLISALRSERAKCQNENTK
jgi:hypothetical protein